VLEYDPREAHEGAYYKHATQASSLQEGKWLAHEILACN
jgi:hypothetical protein